MAEGIYKYVPLWGEWFIDEPPLGKGSYGEVYRIYKNVNGERVYAAAKYISIPKNEQDKELAYNKGLATDEESLKSFFDTRANYFAKEIDLMMKLRNSENIVRYEDHIKVEKNDDIGWDIIIRMELLTPLSEYLKYNSFMRKDVIRLGIDLCKAIENCQKASIIHRDVKIGNVFIDGEGSFKLGDFGVSREAEGTTTGTVTGTEDYMAPEIMKHEKYNNNVDIYSIGVVLYRLLNNSRIPFLPADGPINDNDIAAALSKRLEGNEVPCPKYATERLGEIISKACAYDRHQRYSTPGEMASDLWAIYDLTEDIEVSKPRRSSQSAQANSKNTMSDFGSNNLGMNSFDSLSNSYNNTSDELNESSTVSDISAGSNSGSGQEKKPLWKDKRIIALFAAIAACLVISAVALINRNNAGVNTPQKVQVTDITGIPDYTVNIVEGDTYKLKPSYYPKNAELPENSKEAEFKYESSDENVAIVRKDGTIEAISEGAATVKISGLDFTKEIEVNVTSNKVDVTAIVGINPTAEIKVGEMLQIYCEVEPADATVQTVTYSSSDESVATIGPDGAIWGMGEGTATIYAKADDVTAEMVLTVKPAPVPQQPVYNQSSNSSKSGSGSGSVSNSGSSGKSGSYGGGSGGASSYSSGSGSSSSSGGGSSKSSSSGGGSSSSSSSGGGSSSSSSSSGKQIELGDSGRSDTGAYSGNISNALE